ncbi:MAG: DUF3047 domain-containing protein [Acetobacteraceae bacterium]|jgi:hypothetical protein|nr:DUF3047 domain-containing protein [Acetobacteraceae bacterium]
MRPWLALLPLLFAAFPAAASLDPALVSQGWRSIPVPRGHGTERPPLTVEQDGETGIRIHGQGGAAAIYQPMRVPVGPNTCLAWRWRVDQGPPAMDLTVTASDRGLALWVGFEPDAERMGLLQRYLLGMARMLSGPRMVPGFILHYVHGGSGDEPTWHRAPISGLIGRASVLEPAGSEPGWVEHQVPLSAHFRAAYGIAPTGFVTEIAISADGEDTGAVIDARLSELRFQSCRGAAQPVR